MSSHPDSLLVEERVVLPAYAPSQPASKSLEGCLKRLLGFFSRFMPNAVTQAVEGIVTVKLPPPPTVSGFMTFFRHHQTIQRSREALAAYRSRYEDAGIYPLRIREARHTGLPAFLNGLLDKPKQLESPKDAISVMSEWLFQELHVGALFGLELSAAVPRFDYLASITLNRGHRERDALGTTVHGFYQQKYQEWPIFGGQVVVHLATDNQRFVDRRISVTCSYFPMEGVNDFSPQLSSDQAMRIAQQALSAFLEAPDVVGLAWSLLRPWLEVPSEAGTTPASWGAIPRHIAQRQLWALAGLSDSHDIFRRVKEIVDAGLTKSPGELMAGLRPVWDARRELGLLEWQVNVVHYLSSELIILPFAGQYHLAYLIELIPPSRDEAWRVFVDAENGDVLGRPEGLVVHVPSYYSTADDVQNDILQLLDQTELSEIADAVKDFMLLKLHQDPEGNSLDVSAINPNNVDIRSNDVQLRVNGEAVNIVFHTKRLFDHFVDVCGATALQSVVAPALVALVGKGGTDLDMGFVPATTLHPTPITFQTDSGTGLTVEMPDEPSKKVYGPSLDPEVIYHEIVHGLMWLLKREAADQQIFDQQIASVPFARALMEGYANYFARSVADRFEPFSPSATNLNLWARAAYRKEDAIAPGQAWGSRWALSRDSHVSGEDLLPAPNLYPCDQTEGLTVYDVGMIFARALWDIRNLLGADLADQLALRAFGYVLGWVANFEMLAEGIIDQARLDPGVNDDGVEDIIDIFAQRRILADRGVQTLARLNDGAGNTALLVGTDAGVRRSQTSGTSWEEWGQLNGGELLKGVVALAPEGTTIYAATEQGVYVRNTNDSNWSALGVWPAHHIPLCMLVFHGIPYVGTARGVWYYEKPAGQAGSWQRWEPPGAASENLILDMALTIQNEHQTIKTTNVYVATMFDPKRRLVSWVNEMSPQSDASWDPAGLIDDNGDRGYSTAVEIGEDLAYVGTLEHGIWQQSLSNASTDWSQVATQGDLAHGAVLALRINRQDLYAATTSGLFKGVPGVNAWIWEPIAPPDGFGDIVTDVLPLNGLLLVGTASQGLWVRDGATWTQHLDIGT